MSNQKIRILAFAGSTREASCNKKLLKIAADGAREAKADVTVIDLRDFAMPLYDGDLEAATGLPEAALRLKELMCAHHGFLIASPEYNSGYSAVLKNAIDWVSRPSTENEPGLLAFAGKTASIMAAAPGALGGLRGLYQLRELLMNMRVFVHPNIRAVGNAMQVFSTTGDLTDVNLQAAIKMLGAQTVQAIQLQ
ncbi:NADPH:quinone oxidoreductase [hydrothermal vent metagenome]|uniref:NADPH:quinone oxidoreductase n=1 Tax=hydrothermal vent metagenome TaxID=652676 RepID=A0A3B0RHM6_9ZZZZ